MKITDLLKKLDEVYDDKIHKLVIYEDYSGDVRNNDDRNLIMFSSKKEMEEKVNKLWKEVNDNKEEVEL